MIADFPSNPGCLIKILDYSLLQSLYNWTVKSTKCLNQSGCVSLVNSYLSKYYSTFHFHHDYGRRSKSSRKKVSLPDPISHLILAWAQMTHLALPPAQRLSFFSLDSKKTPSLTFHRPQIFLWKKILSFSTLPSTSVCKLSSWFITVFNNVTFFFRFFGGFFWPVGPSSSWMASQTSVMETPTKDKRLDGAKTSGSVLCQRKRSAVDGFYTSQVVQDFFHQPYVLGKLGT